MVELIEGGVYLAGGRLVRERDAAFPDAGRKEAARRTMAYGVLSAHNAGDDENLRIRFDALVSHDITYVGIIQTAKASGLERFPVPYTLTNCHNSLCAVGGTLNEDDHVFGLSAARHYGGNYVPANLAVIHQYMRETEAGCGVMILGSDSHTRYGALGTLGIGEGGPELVKQLLGKTYDIPRPEVVAVYLDGAPRRGVGPHDVALALVGAVYASGFVKNKVLEFVGPGIAGLSMDFRNGVDVMTTETGCLSSIWETDSVTEEYLSVHGRGDAYREMRPEDDALYDGAVHVDLSRVEPMIAMPFHPSNAYAIRDFLDGAWDILGRVEEEGRELLKDGRFSLRDRMSGDRVYAGQAVIAGCAGGSYENIAEAAEILRGRGCGCGEFSLSVYPQSQPVFKCLIDNGYASSLVSSGAILKPAFCGPCFGAGDTPSNGGFSVRHTTRNFENREGSRLNEGQLSAVALMDARSVAATAANGGAITPATEADYDARIKRYTFDAGIYADRVYRGAGRPDPDAAVVYGANITDWPEQIAMSENVLMRVVSVLDDPVTTTDELIPSGETSTYRSNPERLSSFALSRRDPGYVGRAMEVRSAEAERRSCGKIPRSVADEAAMEIPDGTMYASCVCARKPGDGSAREQAASCQRVLGGIANIALEYATKRYRSNLINWGMIPFRTEDFHFEVGDFVYIPRVRDAVKRCGRIHATLVRDREASDITLIIDPMTEDEKDIILSGCLINHNRTGS